MKLSIVILCWNDRKVIGDCLQSIYATTSFTDYEVIVPDNGSRDGSIEFIRETFPEVRVIENGRNLRFAKANNVGIRASCGEYILILNPDTILHAGCLDHMMNFADRHPEAGAFGCRVLNTDGSYQVSARPFASLKGELIAALYLRWLGRLSEWFTADLYVNWCGMSVRRVDWVSGCFILARAELLKSIGGFDEQFFYYYEDMDLCRRIRRAGYSILYSPDATMTHLGGQSTKSRFTPLPFVLDGQVTRYLYYYKYYGTSGVWQARRIIFLSLLLRLSAFRLKHLMHPTEAVRRRLETLRGVFDWNRRVNPVRLVEYGEEPRLQTLSPNRIAER